MQKQIILNRIEKEIKEYQKYVDYCNNQLKELEYKEDILLVKRNKKEAENVIYVLSKIKKYKNVPLMKDYLSEKKEV